MKYMITWFSITGMLISIYGVITESIKLGIAFIISLMIFLFTLFSIFNRNSKLTELGLALMIVSLLLLSYTVCYLFLGIDVKAALGL